MVRRSNSCLADFGSGGGRGAGGAGRPAFGDDTMNRTDSVERRGRRRGRTAVWALGAFLLGLVGCFPGGQQTRLQSEDESERERYGIKTVGDVTLVGNAEPIALGGVGLVTDLEGTGGDSPPDGYRAMLVDQLRKRGARKANEILSDPANALVIVTAQIPPGAAKNDPIDVEVILPPGSRATSLRGGVLKACQLFNYDFTRRLDPSYSGPQSLLLGHPIARAEGPVLVGMGDGDDAARVKQGRIWGGGRTLIDQPLSLVMKADQQYARMTVQVAGRINATFFSTLRGPDASLATPRTNQAVLLRVPAAYRLNLPRFLRVVRLIPLEPVAMVPAEGERRSYPQQLAEELTDPARTVTAALRLEALGKSSIPALKRGLENKNPLVRFCSAEALAYLGEPLCAEELAHAVAQQPLLRAFGLTALASLDEAVCQLKLGDLLVNARDDETRYGAFRALRALDEHNRMVQGELLNDSFWVHRVAPGTPGLIHFSSTRRAEIVLFGDEPRLQPPFSFLAGDFAVTATEDDTRCTVSRFPLRGTPSRRQCPLTLHDVIRTMAAQGADYPDVVALLQQADAYHSLSCRVRCDALPQAVSAYDLVRVGRNQSDQAELLTAGQDLGATPTLYDLGLPSQSALARDQEAMARDRKSRTAAATTAGVGARPSGQ